MGSVCSRDERFWLAIGGRGERGRRRRRSGGSRSRSRSRRRALMTVKTNHTGQVNWRSPPQKDDPFFFSLSLSLFPSFLPLGISLLLACLLAEGMGPGPQGDPGISLSLSRVGGRGSIQAPTPCGPHTRGSWRDKLPPQSYFL